MIPAEVSSFSQRPLSDRPTGDFRFQPPKKKRRFNSKLGCLSCLLIIAIFVIWLMTNIIGAANKSFLSGVREGYIFRQLTHIFNVGDTTLRGESEDRINFLLLGMGGPGHEGPYLSDTMILASFKPSTKEVALLSIPRDLVVPFGDGTYRKVNSVFALSLDQGLNQAFSRTKQVVGQAFGQEIDYMATVDFQGFVEIVDALGGVTVDVERAFVDNQFPDGEDKTTSVSFQAGEQKMNGLTALRYARSRHGNNGEGSDFARSRRQQKIILAVKDKLATFNTLINPVRITSLFNLLSDYTRTDLEPWEAIKLARLFHDVDGPSIQHLVLDDAPGGFLIGGISSSDGAYILQPNTGSYRELQQYVADIFNNSAGNAEQSYIIIQNGTPLPGLALEEVNQLTKSGLSVSRYGNADKKDYQLTLLYDYTGGQKPVTRKILEEHFGVIAKTNPPLELSPQAVAAAWQIKDDQGQLKNPDFLIILGNNLTLAEPRPLIVPTLLFTPSSTTSTLPLQDQTTATDTPATE